MKTGSEGKDKNIVYVFVPFRFGNTDVVVNARSGSRSRADGSREIAKGGGS